MDSPQTPQSDNSWERKTLEKLAFSALAEQRSRRRWGIFFKFLGFTYLLVILATVVEWDKDAGTDRKHTALVDMQGVIAAKSCAKGLEGD